MSVIGLRILAKLENQGAFGLWDDGAIYPEIEFWVLWIVINSCSVNIAYKLYILYELYVLFRCMCLISFTEFNCIELFVCCIVHLVRSATAKVQIKVMESVKVYRWETHKQGICTNDTDNNKEPFGVWTITIGWEYNKYCEWWSACACGQWGDLLANQHNLTLKLFFFSPLFLFKFHPLILKFQKGLITFFQPISYWLHHLQCHSYYFSLSPLSFISFHCSIAYWCSWPHFTTTLGFIYSYVTIIYKYEKSSLRKNSVK